jgi:predicted nucleic acid-binding Zn ribbon protein
MLKSLSLELAVRRSGIGIALEPAGIGLEKIVAKSLRQAPSAEAPLMAWPIVCGSAVAERTRALDFHDGLLTVAVADAGWKSELQSLAARYLAVINRYTAEPVHRIEFVVESAEEKAPRP